MCQYWRVGWVAAGYRESISHFETPKMAKGIIIRVNISCLPKQMVPSIRVALEAGAIHQSIYRARIAQCLHLHKHFDTKRFFNDFKLSWCASIEEFVCCHKVRIQNIRNSYCNDKHDKNRFLKQKGAAWLVIGSLIQSKADGMENCCFDCCCVLKCVNGYWN